MVRKEELTTVVFATRNVGKLRELERLVTFLPWRFESLEKHPGAPEVIEDGDTFLVNAALKAISAYRHTGRPALADDSGLCVDALGGEPGVFSSSFGGQEGNSARNNERLLAELAHVRCPEERGAWFVSTLVLLGPESLFGEAALGARGSASRRVLDIVPPDCALHVFEGRSRGTILFAPRGSGGFGYDPLFASREVQTHRALADRPTFAELPLEEKNAVSHRGRAFAAFAAFCQRLRSVGLG